MEFEGRSKRPVDLLSMAEAEIAEASVHITRGENMEASGKARSAAHVLLRAADTLKGRIAKMSMGGGEAA